MAKREIQSSDLTSRIGFRTSGHIVLIDHGNKEAKFLYQGRGTITQTDKSSPVQGIGNDQSWDMHLKLLSSSCVEIIKLNALTKLVPEYSNLTRVSLGSCHQVTELFFVTGQQGILTGQISSPMNTCPRKSNQKICFCHVQEVFGCNRANFLNDRSEGPAKTINIKTPETLVKLPKILTTFGFFTENL